MKLCIFAAALFNVLCKNLLLARSLVIIDVDSLRRHLDHKQVSRRSNAGPDPSVLRPAEYLRTALSLLYTYSDDDLEDVVSSFVRELKRLRYSDNSIYNFLLDKVVQLERQPASEVKEQLVELIHLLESDLVKDLTLRLKSESEVQAARQLVDVLRILDTYRYRSKKRSYDLMESIKASLRTAVNMLLGEAPTTTTTAAPTPAPAQALRIPPDLFSVSPRTMRAMVDAVNFAYKWINLIAEKKGRDRLNDAVRGLRLPDEERGALRQKAPYLDVK